MTVAPTWLRAELLSSRLAPEEALCDPIRWIDLDEGLLLAGGALEPGKVDLPPEFIVRALPGLVSDVPGDHPRMLFWDDGGDRDENLRWRWALADLGFNEGVDYDLYETLSPASGVGNGLGGRATSAQLAGYGVLLYTCGDLAGFTLSNGDFDDDPSADLVVLSNWFERGFKRALMVGDNVVSSLIAAGAVGASFVNNYLGTDLSGTNPLGTQTFGINNFFFKFFHCCYIIRYFDNVGYAIAASH